MSDKTYNWNRYWVPREGSFAFDLEGFLLPPSENREWPVWSKTDAVGFEVMAEIPCLILLGEPGIGKSFALRNAKNHLKSGNKSANYLSVNLGEYADENRLINEVFKSSEFLAWQSQGAELHIFFDSFDECLLRLDTVATILAKQLTELENVEGLFIRITSRTAEWRMSLEEALKRKWGDDKVSVFELAPLTKDQILVATTANVSNPEKFMREVLNREVVPFAIKPLTLELLFRVWKAGDGSLPLTQREIYEKGCLELCSESNQDRDTPKLKRKFTSEERRAVASQIAAATVFCKRSAVYKGLKPLEILETDISLSGLAHGSATANGRSVTVTEELLRETLDTGLFSARGPHRLGWAHQTYAEFLAANYVREQNFTSKQILDIIVHPFEGKRLVPQLQEVTSWIAIGNKAIFDYVLHTEPDVLLRSDVASADDSIKEKIIEALLLAVGEHGFRPDLWALRARYAKLNYPGLGTQLKKLLRNKSLPIGGRSEAMRIIDANKLQPLIPLVVNFALDETENQNVREAAAEVTSKHGGRSARRKLKPLALGLAPEKTGLELRGWALKACWPEHITADELFNSIVKPDIWCRGAYTSFLSDDFIEGLSAEDLPTALRWAAIQPKNHANPLDEWEALAPHILEKSANQLENTSVLQAFAPALLSRLRKYDLEFGRDAGNFDEVLKKFPEQRLKLVEAIIPHIEDAKQDSAHLVRWGFKKILADDFYWLLSQLKKEENPRFRRNISYIMLYLYCPDNAQQADTVITAAEEDPIFSDVFSVWLKPTDLTSEKAAQAKMFFLETERWKTKAARNEPKPLTPTPAEQICNCLAKFEAGNLDAWWHGSTWAELDDNGQYAKDSHRIDYVELPGWKNATDETKARLVSAAHQYISNCEAKSEIWFYWRGKKYRPGIAGLRALILLSKQAPELFAKLSKQIWVNWLPAIFRNEHYSEAGEFRMLATSAFQKAPQDAIELIIRVLNQESKEGEHFPIINKLPSKIDPILGAALLVRLKRGRLKVTATNQLMELLLTQQIQGAIDFVRRCIPKHAPRNVRRRTIALHSARLLLKHGGVDDWPNINRLIVADEDFGKSLFEGCSHDYNHQLSALVRILTERDISCLWEWMQARYPVANDPPERKNGLGGSVTTLWAMADIREGLIFYLADLGTIEAWKELLGLANKYGDMPWIRQMLTRCGEQLRRNSWHPPLPEQIFKLAENQRGRLVQSADQLLDVVCDTIEGLQDKLHGATPAARFLWSKDRPMEEDALSDWIKIELEEAFVNRGVVLNREVQIHIKERTDIHVDAISRDVRTGKFGGIKVIIEVKGCWHRELKSAMEAQLVNRYLSNNDCNHGIYLVGWFMCNAWSKKDSRRKNLKFKNLAELRVYLSGQAASLSSDDKRIRALVLDVSLPWVKVRKDQKKTRTQRKT